MEREADSGDLVHLELERRLETCHDTEPEGPWRIEAQLKDSPAEVTQLVWLRTAGGGELGPYARKLIEPDSGLGRVWQRLWQCQRQGLRSRQLPRVICCEERDGQLAVVMERVVGPTLRERVVAAPAADRVSLARTLVSGLCSAAAELNESLGEVVVHRDITPSNVICSGLHEDVPVLIDLGIARVWSEGRDVDTTHFGTRAYAPPEQFGFGQTDLRTDVYAIGMCAFFCLTGRDPTPQDREANFDAPEIPAEWREVIARACAFDPSERYGSARELGGALAGLAGRPVEDSLGEREPKRPQGSTLRRAALRAWHARNLVVIPLVALLVWASTANVFDPAALSRGNPWYNAFGYLVYMNYCFVALGYVAMDKRWLYRHVRALRELPPRRAYAFLAMVFVALTVLLFALSGLAG